ncbi:sugar phosphate isomerase/epimerase [Roseomonas frigidaquae]|uniref:Sugar phosphate isomerase/epimerase n=1 Tax=Falsiroseomonas frigidaquae TaxID=487318 RepID=A0ABX1F3X8_9PROT|nr:sugar phosphate isomerase/epimerase [Falsiroseomonas frigidaquae]NKE47073.1 sugar phosphate isomerase/epimerase [Falsiroseomonas frigidaquae]
MAPPLSLTIQVKDPDWADLPAALDDAAALGVEIAELPLHALDVIVGGRIQDRRLADVRRICAGRGLGYVLHGHLGINLMEDPFRVPLHLEVLRANIAAAAALECRNLVIHSGFVPTVQSAGIEAAFDRQREHLSRMGDVARDHGVTLCVENIFEFTGIKATALPGRLAKELRAIAHPNVMATFDISHGWLHCGQWGVDFLEEARALAPLSRHLHLHDSFGRPNDFWTYSVTEALAFGIGDLHLPMGWGSIPWDSLAEACTWPDDLVADVEVNHRYRSAFPEAIAASRAWAARLQLAPAPFALAAE